MKKCLLFVILIAAFTSLFADKVGINDATNVAINFYRQNVAISQYEKGIIEDYEKAIALENIKFEVDSLIIDNLTVSYYFNFKPKGVINVCATNAFDPVAMWSEEGSVNVKHAFTHRNDPGVISTVRFDKENYIYKNYFTQPNQETLEKWNLYKISPEKFIVKKNSKSEGSNGKTPGKSQTFTKWHQLSPYWYDCPADSVNGQTVVGCVGIAMAQMMKYHQWPEIGIGSFEYNLPVWGTQSSDFSQHSYNWAIMPDSAYTNTSDSTLQVAQICKDAGVSVNMEYGTAASHPSPDKAYFFGSLAEFFNYTCNNFVPYSSYSGNTVGWYSRIQNEVALRPVFYNTESHSMILDDYNSSTGYYHVNIGNTPGAITPTLSWLNAAQLESIGTPLSIITDIIPDRNDNPLPIPYSQNFDGILKNEIPANTASLHNNSVQDLYGFENTYHLKALLDNNSSTVAVPDSSWFVIKKISLACDSVPVLKFKYRIDRTLNPVSLNPGDSMTVEVSKDNRLTWKQISSITSSNHPYTIDYLDKIISLNEFRNEIVNIRFKYFLDANTASINYRLDNLEVGLLQLSFPELTDNMTLSPKTAQSVKVSPSIETPPKSKGFEDYDMIMDYYVKEDIEEADYSLAYSDSVLENGVFEFPDLNTDDYIGKNIKVRAVARTKSSSLTIKSAEISLKISGRQCSVDFPLPATESWFDFETRLIFETSILAEPSFADSLNNVLIGFDVYDDYQSQVYSDYYQEEINISVLDPWYIENYCVDSTNYFCNISKEAKAQFFDRDLKKIDKNFVKSNSTKFFEIGNSISSDKIIGNPKDLTAHHITPIRYPRSLDLYPGTYTVFMMAIRKDLYEYDGTISEIAKHDSLQFIIPQWKLKMRKDFYAPDQVPYVDKSTFEKSKNVEMIVWRPWIATFYNPYYIDIIRKSDNQTVASFVKDLEENNDAYNIYNWETNQSTQADFYEIKTKCIDTYVPIEIKQEKNIQMCPLYVSWENSGNWSDSWSGTDSDFWKIHWYNYSNILGNYALGAEFNTAEDSVDRSISSPTVSLDQNYDAECQVLIGIPTTDGINFDELKANYSALVSQDGGSKWTMIRTALVSEYEGYSWNTTPGHKFLIWSTTIKNTGDKTVKVKLITKNETTYEDSILQMVCFDEIRVKYRGPVPPSPDNFAGNSDGNSVSLSWGGVGSKGKSADYYQIYRNGNEIASTTELSYADTSIVENSLYNYSVVAFYQDTETGIWDKSSMLDCSLDIFSSQLTAPANLVIANTSGNVTLSWDAVTGATGYKVFSSADPYGTFTEDTSGTLNGVEWTAPTSTTKLFYYVVAVNDNTKEREILKTSGNQVK